MTNNLICFIVVYINDSPETKGLSAVLKSQAYILLPLSQSWQDLRLQSPGKRQPLLPSPTSWGQLFWSVANSWYSTYCRFLYEYSRRHPEFSAQMLLRIGKGYEELLKECCKTSCPPEGWAPSWLTQHTDGFKHVTTRLEYPYPRSRASTDSSCNKPNKGQKAWLIHVWKK